MGLFKDIKCTVLDRNEYGSDAIIGYTNDACLPVDIALWTKVTCGYYDGHSDTTIITTIDAGNESVSMYNRCYVGLLSVMIYLAIGMRF